MKYGFAAAVLAMSVLPAFAVQLAPISPHQALANKGQCVNIEGTASVRSDPQRPGLDVDLDGKDSSAFGYILPQNQAQFPDIKSIEGRRVAITGVVTIYMGRAQIHMTSARQLTPAGGNADRGLTHVGPEWAKGDPNAVCGA